MGGNNLSTRALTVPIPFSIPAICVGVKRFASLRRGRGRRGGHRFQQLAGDIGAVPVHPDQEIRAGQLRRGHREQQAPGGVP